MENIVSKQELKEEALFRLSLLTDFGLHPHVKRDFEKSNTVCCSVRSKVVLDEGKQEYFAGANFWLSESDEISQAIAKFEKEYDALVYFCTTENTEFGRLADLFYVSRHKDEWEMDRESLAARYPFVYVVNLDDDVCSEFGSIGVFFSGGGCLRVA